MRTPKCQNKNVENKLSKYTTMQLKINIKIKIFGKIAIIEDQKEKSKTKQRAIKISY